jgi:integrase/recombinase XerD
MSKIVDDVDDDQPDEPTDSPNRMLTAPSRRGGRPRSENRMAIIPFISPELLHGIEPGSDELIPADDALIAGQFSDHTRRAYEGDVLLFRQFIAAIGRASLGEVIRDDLIAYRAWLISRYAPATVNRRLSVVRSLFKEALIRGEVTADPTVNLKQMHVNDESPTVALDQLGARLLLEQIDRSTLLGVRDVAILSLMLRTGLRRSEIGSLKVGSLGVERGHHTLTVRGKGDKRRLVKVPVDVWRDIQTWLKLREDVERRHNACELLPNDAPLFVEVRKIGRGDGAHYRAIGQKGLSPDAIWIIVKRHITAAGITANITPHSLRHTFITLALEGRAPLHKVQYAAGHADPRTTERYHHKKDNLDDNATDYVRI